MGHDCHISNLKRLNSRRVIALFSLELPSGTMINSCILKYSEDKRSFTIIPPQIPLLDASGSILKDHRGEVKFAAAISFRRQTTRAHFEHVTLKALREQHPELFNRQK
jgi:hypothetical protein